MGNIMNIINSGIFAANGGANARSFQMKCGRVGGRRRARLWFVAAAALAAMLGAQAAQAGPPGSPNLTQNATTPTTSLDFTWTKGSGDANGPLASHTVALRVLGTDYC